MQESAPPPKRQRTEEEPAAGFAQRPAWPEQPTSQQPLWGNSDAGLQQAAPFGAASSFGSLATLQPASFGALAAAAGSTTTSGLGGVKAESTKRKRREEDEDNNDEDGEEDGASSQGEDAGGKSEEEEEENARANGAFGASAGESKSQAQVFLNCAPVSRITGEEEEENVFQVRAKLFRMAKGSESGKEESRWQEVGTGQLRVNIAMVPNGSDATENAPEKDSDKPRFQMRPRLVMRREGVLKLLLNGFLLPNIPLEKTGDKMIRFSIESHTDDFKGLGLFLLKFSRDSDCTELFNLISKLRESQAKTEEKEKEKSQDKGNGEKSNGDKEKETNGEETKEKQGEKKVLDGEVKEDGKNEKSEGEKEGEEEQQLNSKQEQDGEQTKQQD